MNAVARLSAVPILLRVLCETTGMGFAAVARITDRTWTACAVLDDIEFGLKAGAPLELDSTLCALVRATGMPLVIEEAGADPRYRSHPMPKQYGVESYVSVPIVLPDRRYFGTLCAIDRASAKLADPRILSMFNRFAELIALQLDAELARRAAPMRHASPAREPGGGASLDESESAELRDQLLALLGHDLRNPLQAVNASGELLERKMTDPALAKIAARIRVNVRRMSALIDDVLDLAKGRLDGGIELHRVSVEDAGAAFASMVQEFREGRPERHIDSRIDLPGAIRCDRPRMRQLVFNLLGNASTHGAADGTVKFSALLDGDDLVIQVSNEGSPIPAENLPRLFLPFWRGESAAARRGLGLGLYLCALIARAHGGRIEVRSTAQEGTTFTVRIPAAPP